MAGDAEAVETGEGAGCCLDFEDAAAAGHSLSGLPSGLRVRVLGRRRELEEELGDGDEGDFWGGAERKRAGGALEALAFEEAVLLGLALALSLISIVWLGSCHLGVAGPLPSLDRPEAGPGPPSSGAVAAAAPGGACRQCQQAWWDSFWRWRLGGPNSDQKPPRGMEWEWDPGGDDTDWYGTSSDLVHSVVAPHADPALGPVLQVGCGDSPLPKFLHDAGFQSSVHLDISPVVVDLMRARHSPERFPNMSFEHRDFLLHGASPPPHRFSAVVDKAGIWDWLQEEAPDRLPALLSAVWDALVLAPKPGVYVVATKLPPRQMADALIRARAPFVGQVSRPLGSNGIAFAYVLEPRLNLRPVTDVRP